jgi:hypothetical protein
MELQKRGYDHEFHVVHADGRFLAMTLSRELARDIADSQVRAGVSCFVRRVRRVHTACAARSVSKVLDRPPTRGPGGGR